MAAIKLSERAMFVRDGQQTLTRIIEVIQSGEAKLKETKKEYIKAQDAFISAFYLLLVKYNGNVHKYVILPTGEDGFRKKTREDLKCIDSNPVFTLMTPELFSYHFHNNLDLMLTFLADNADEIVKKIKE